MQLPPFTPVVRAALILLGAIFVVQLGGAAALGFDEGRYAAIVLGWLAVSSDAVLSGRIWTVFTYALLHSMDGVGHLLFNSLALWWFGAPLEQQIGGRRLTRVLVLGAIGGGLAVVLADLIGIGAGARVVGASGATNAVVACLLWRNRDHWFSFFVRLRGWQWLALFVLIDVARAGATNVSLAAHIGGVLVGMALAHYGVPGGGNPLRRAWLKFKLWRTRRRLKTIRGGLDPDDDRPSTLH